MTADKLAQSQMAVFGIEAVMALDSRPPYGLSGCGLKVSCCNPAVI